MLINISTLDILDADVRVYTLSLLPPSSLRCWSMTCRTYLSSSVGNKTLDVLCCECDDLELLQKLVERGHRPTQSHSDLAAVSGSFHVYDFLCTLDKNLHYNRETRKELFSRCLSPLEKISLEVLGEVGLDFKSDKELREKLHKFHCLSAAANIYLVISGARRAFLWNFLFMYTEEMRREMDKVPPGGTGNTLCLLVIGARMSVLVRNDCLIELLMKGGLTMDALFGYECARGVRSESGGVYLISFEIAYAEDQRRVDLYSYSCTVDAYEKEYCEKDLQKLREFRHHLTPLGVRVEYVRRRIA